MNLAGVALLSVSLGIAVPLYGIWGAVLAPVAQQFCTNTLAFYFFRRM